MIFSHHVNIIEHDVNVHQQIPVSAFNGHFRLKRNPLQQILLSDKSIFLFGPHESYWPILVPWFFMFERRITLMNRKKTGLILFYFGNSINTLEFYSVTLSQLNRSNERRDFNKIGMEILLFLIKNIGQSLSKNRHTQRQSRGQKQLYIYAHPESTFYKKRSKV